MNSINQICFENFRNFTQAHKVPLKPITLIYGANSSGKSSLVKAIQWMSAIRQGRLKDAFAANVSRGSEEKPVSLGFEFSLNPAAEPTSGLWRHLAQAGLGLKSVEVQLKIETAKSAFTRGGMEGIRETLFPEHPGPRVSELCLMANTEIFARFKFAYDLGLKFELPDFVGLEVPFGLRLEWLNPQHPIAIEAVSYILSEGQKCLQKYLIGEASEHPSGSAPEEALLRKSFYDGFQKLLEELERSEVSDWLDFCVASAQDWVVMEDNLSAKNSANFFSKQKLLFMDAHVTSSSTVTLGSLIEYWSAVTFARIAHDLIRPTEINLHNVPLGEEDFFHIPSLRENPKGPFFIRSDDPRLTPPAGWPSVGTSAIDSANAWLAVLAQKRSDCQFQVEYEVVSEMRETSIGVEHTERRGVRITGIRDLRRDIIVPFVQVGTGFSQLIPVLLTIFQNQEALIAIEQPELHLHPALQAELGDLLVTGSVARRDAPRPNQFLIETHSEHLLLRLMRRIRETTSGSLPDPSLAIQPEDLQVLFVEDLGSHSIIREMPINEQGELVRDWPGGFFEEGLRELLM